MDLFPMVTFPAIMNVSRLLKLSIKLIILLPNNLVKRSNLDQLLL